MHLAHYTKNLDVLVYGLKKDGTLQKRPFTSLTTADSDYISLLLGCGIKDFEDLELLCSRSSDLKELFCVLRERGWEDCIVKYWRADTYVPESVKQDVQHELNNIRKERLFIKE